MGIESCVPITAEITGIKYRPFLCNKLLEFPIDEIGEAFSKRGSFILKRNDDKKIALSWWRTPKRTRTYPFARVYDTLDFDGKKVTVIPIYIDEGLEGDCDTIQWDTISLMSLLGIYIIISYYVRAEKHKKYSNKIRYQKFDHSYILTQIEELFKYQSDPLHWNLKQSEKAMIIGNKAIQSYENISKTLGVKMHSFEKMKTRFAKVFIDSKSFLTESRILAQRAQLREVKTIQPKEKLNGIKGTIIIKNYLRGEYYLTCDEIEANGDCLKLIECKYSLLNILPSLADIKDGLLKLYLYSNLTNVMINGKRYEPKPCLKLLTGKSDQLYSFTKTHREIIQKLLKEAIENNIQIQINNKLISELL